MSERARMRGRAKPVTNTASSKGCLGACSSLATATYVQSPKYKRASELRNVAEINNTGKTRDSTGTVWIQCMRDSRIYRRDRDVYDRPRDSLRIGSGIGGAGVGGGERYFRCIVTLAAVDHEEMEEAHPVGSHSSWYFHVFLRGVLPRLAFSRARFDQGLGDERGYLRSGRMIGMGHGKRALRPRSQVSARCGTDGWLRRTQRLSCEK